MHERFIGFQPFDDGAPDTSCEKQYTNMCAELSIVSTMLDNPRGLYDECSVRDMKTIAEILTATLQHYQSEENYQQFMQQVESQEFDPGRTDRLKKFDEWYNLKKILDLNEL